VAGSLLCRFKPLIERNPTGACGRFAVVSVQAGNCIVVENPLESLRGFAECVGASRKLQNLFHKCLAIL
jgi:hypothetical protein